MQLKKKYLTLFYLALSQAKAKSLSEARIRDELATKSLYDSLRDFEEARLKIYKELCIKDDKDEPILLEGDKYTFSPENTPKMQAEVDILESEEIELKVKNPEKIKELIENTAYEPKIGEALIIDEIIALL